MRVLTVLTLSVVVACGKMGGGADAGAIDAGAAPPPVCLPDMDDAGSTDAGLDFSCRGRAAASGGQAQLVISGRASREGLPRTAMEGIRVELLQFDGTVIASAVSNDAGLYQLTYDAGCFPVAGEVRATPPTPDAGFTLSYFALSSPWRFDRSGLELVLFDAQTRTIVAAVANVALIDGTAVLAVTVKDCVGNDVQGALVSTTGNVGVVRYVGAARLPTTTEMSTGATGAAVIFNVPGNSVEVVATLDGGVIARRAVQVHADAATATYLTP